MAATHPLMEQERPGGELLPRVMDFVVACRAVDPDGDYPHVGDLQWWFRDASLESPDHWRFWRDAQQDVIAVGLAYDGITCLMHPRARSHELEAEVRTWAIQHLEEQARQLGPGTRYELYEEAGDDDPEKIALLEREGFTRGDWYYLRFHRPLDAPIMKPSLPQGFAIRPVGGVAEVEERARLHRDSFYPYTSKTYEESTALYRRCMNMPGYDPQLDLVAVAPDGTFATGCICWVDAASQAGLFEPIGTRPAFRRRGLATALMWAGLQQLKARGAVRALVGANHPGEQASMIPVEFTSSRFVFQSVGFRRQRSVFRYIKECEIP